MNRLTDDQRQMVEDYYSSACKQATRIAQKKGMPFDAALSGVCVGYMDAATRHDPAKGAFATIAGRRAIGQVADDGRLNARWTCGSRGIDFRPSTNRDDREFDRASRPSNSIDEIDAFNAMIFGLERDQLLVMKLRYIEGLTMKQAGKAVGVSESRASQIHDDAIKVLKSRATR